VILGEEPYCALSCDRDASQEDLIGYLNLPQKALVTALSEESYEAIEARADGTVAFTGLCSQGQQTVASPQGVGPESTWRWACCDGCHYSPDDFLGMCAEQVQTAARETLRKVFVGLSLSNHREVTQPNTGEPATSSAAIVGKSSDPLAEIQRFQKIICSPGEVYEVRALDTLRGAIVSGYYKDQERLAHDSKRCTSDLKAHGTYMTINPCQPQLLNRAINRLREYVKKDTTSDSNISRRRWIPLDFDPVRAGGVSGIAATEKEHAAALAKAREVREFLTSREFPAPILMDSGNGAYLLYAVDLQNDKESTVLVKAVM
jgi:hypothetical protein